MGRLNPGLRPLEPFNRTRADLVDTNGAIVQTWTTAFLMACGARLDAGRYAAAGDHVAQPTARRRRVRRRPEARVEQQRARWTTRTPSAPACHWTYHDIEVMPNGHVLLIELGHQVHGPGHRARPEPVADPGHDHRPRRSRHRGGPDRSRPRAASSGSWHVLDHVIQEADATKPSFGVAAQHPELIDFNYLPIAFQASDINHMNSVNYDPVRRLARSSARTTRTRSG